MLNTIKFITLLNVFLMAYGLPLSQNCGKSFNTAQPDWRIAGGTDAAVGEFPWQVLLTPVKDNVIIHGRWSDFDFCGGTIINERWILTAGHCIHNVITQIITKANELKVRLGVHNFTIEEKDKEFDILVEKIVPHQQFDHTLFTFQNDIALIKLNESLEFNGKHKHLSPICLARSDSKLTNKCVATGFGFINCDKDRPINGILQKVDEPYAHPSRCKKEFLVFNESIFNETQSICAGGLVKGGKGVCNGDSGGPLQCQAEDGRWHQVGIASYGRPCALPNTPDVFTKVSYYLDWIQKTISSH